MILVRTPLRICLAGGGTDLQAYSSRFGGRIISAAIDKYVYVTLNKHLEDTYLLKYSKSEQVNEAKEIRHSIIRAVFELLKISNGIEMTTFMDLPSQTGLGSSSSFTVGLIHAVCALTRRNVTKRELAELAIFVEREILGEVGGKQDQFIASFGGIHVIQVDKFGAVKIWPLGIGYDIVLSLESRLLMFYTGVRRVSSIVQEEVTHHIEGDQKTIDHLHRIKEIGMESENALFDGDLNEFGLLMDKHWQEKRSMIDSISSKGIDRIYKLGKENGALGGKLIGAGGGGFLLFYCLDRQEDLRRVMMSEGLKELRFGFENRGGSTVVVNSGGVVES